MEYKKTKSNNNSSYEKLRDGLKNGNIAVCYIFYGQEQYLLQHCLDKLREALCLGGLDGFNYKRFDGSVFSPRQGGDSSAVFAPMLEEAVEVFPLFAQRNLIEVHDYDIFKAGEAEREHLCRILAGLPEHVCVVFVYSAIEYKADNRLKISKELNKYAEIVEFAIQDESKLGTWITRRFRSAGKEIKQTDVNYLIQITGGLMTAMNNEIEKVAAYAKGQVIQRSDIDAVVMPVLDAVVYKLTDAIVRRDNKAAMQILGMLLQMREVPHKLLYSISLKMRQLLAARICIDNKIAKQEYMKICKIFSDYPAQILLNTAKMAKLSYCREAVLICSQSAKELNSSAEGEARIVELVTKLALING